MNAAEMNIMGILHSQAILARSEELFVDRSQIQGPSIDIMVINWIKEIEKRGSLPSFTTANSPSLI
jgi:hypothetical protein